MAGGKTFPHEALPEGYFGAQKHITREPDDYPDLWELLNSTRKGGGAKAGTDIIPNGAAIKVVTFATAFTAGTTVRVIVTMKDDPGVGNNVWVDTVSVTGFTVHTTGNVGADTDFDYIAQETD